MKKGHRSVGLVGGFTVLFLAAGVAAQDWPQWRGANRDGKVAGFATPQTWPKSLTQKWQATVGSGDATPALVGDKLFVFARQGDNEVTLCLDAASGKELWQDKCPAPPVKGPAARHPGPRSSPTVADGKIVTLGVSGILSCLDAATGKLIWRTDEFTKVPQFFTAMSPIVVDGLCVAHLGGKGDGAVIAFDLATGGQKWKWTGDGPAYASPVLMTVDGIKQIVVQTEQNLLGLAVADGKRLWQVASPPQGRAYNSATPIIDGATVVFTGQGRGTKALKVERTADGFAAKELWVNESLGAGYNTPVLKDGLLFGLSDKGFLFCISAKSGQTAWTDSTKLDNFGSVVDAGSALLALPSSSDLIAFRPTDKQYEELTRIKVSQSATYAHPVLAGKRVFVKDSEAVTMWTVE